MNFSSRLGVFLGIQLAAGATLLACGGEDEPEPSDGDTTGDMGRADAGSSEPSGGGTGTLQFTYSPMYSAFVEGHEAQVPVLLKDTSLRGKGAKFTSSDPAVAAVSDTEQGATITIKKEGTATIRVALDGETGAAKLTVTKFTEAQWSAGQARFSKSELAIVPPDGSAVTALALANPAARNPNGACNTCHTAQAKTLKIENTPTQIAGYSDSELITIFTKGMKPEGVAQRTMVPSYAWGQFHSWDVTEDEKQGLIAFLRTQAPKANPAMVDYGVQLCPGAPAPTANEPPMLCDNDGKPVTLPGQGGGTAPDAGAPRPSDAGATAEDAGSAGDAG